MDYPLNMRPTVCFEVQRIIEVSVGHGNVKNYKVQWAPTWVSGAHLFGCDHLIEEYLEKEQCGMAQSNSPYQNCNDSHSKLEKAKSDNFIDIIGHRERHVIIKNKCDGPSETKNGGDVFDSCHFTKDNVSTQKESVAISTSASGVNSCNVSETGKSDVHKTFHKSIIQHESTGDSHCNSIPVQIKKQKIHNRYTMKESIREESCETTSSFKNQNSDYVHRKNNLDKNLQNSDKETFCQTLLSRESMDDELSATLYTSSSTDKDKSSSTPLYLQEDHLEKETPGNTSFNIVIVKDEEIECNSTSQTENNNSHLYPYDSYDTRTCSAEATFDDESPIVEKTQEYRFIKDLQVMHDIENSKLVYSDNSQVTDIGHSTESNVSQGKKSTKYGRYVCTICGKKVSTKTNLIGHYSTHTGERPYSCDICASTFTCKSNLRRHMKKHEKHFKKFNNS